MGFLSSVAGIGGSFLGKVLDYEYGRKLQHDSQDWQEKMYRQRHQMEIEDLKAAGLNPILSAVGSAGGVGGSGIASTGPMQNPAIASASVAKLVAETKATKQAAAESKAREELIKNQADSASAIAVKEGIEAKRKLREFKYVDESDFGKRGLPLVESMPGSLRGPLRFGVSGLSWLKDAVLDGYKASREIYKRFKSGTLMSKWKGKKVKGKSEKSRK